MSAPALLVAIPLLAGVAAGALSGAGSRAGLIVLGIAWLAATIGLWRRRRMVVVLATIAGCLGAGVASGARAAGAAGDCAARIGQERGFDEGDGARRVVE